MPKYALILAPHGRDAALAQAMLSEAGLESEIVPTLDALIANLGVDVDFAVLTEEAIVDADTTTLHAWLERQPDWSDFPFILLTKRGGIERNPAASRYIDLLGNVTFVERPFHPTTLVALTKSALRGRRKQYEARERLEALHRSDERFRAAIHAVQGVLWTNTANGQMEGDQLAWSALTGQTPAEYQGYGWSNAVHPDDAQPTVDAWNIAVEQKKLFEFEHRVRTRNGEWRIFSIRAIPTFTTNGALREWVGVHTDVTAQRASESELRDLNLNLAYRVREAVAERNIFADIIETTDTFMQVVDFDLRWLAINRACIEEFQRVYGRRPRVGDSLLELMSSQPEHRDQLTALWRRALAGETFTVTALFGNAEFEQNRYEVRFAVLRDASDTPIGAFQIATNVEQRMRDAEQLADTQDALRQAQKMEAIGQLTGGVAHDFNNLLTIIRGGAEFLQRPNIAPERSRLIVDGIYDAADRAAKLTQQLLAFSRRQPLRPVVFDVSDRTNVTIEMLRSIVGARITLDVICDPDLKVNADVAQFETALVNLCLNARDAIRGDGQITIRGLRVNGNVHVTVDDNGEGIASDVLPRLFEPFFTTKSVGEGTGLGLSQVYGFAKQSGGDVQVRSTVGIGTCFTLILPASRAALPEIVETKSISASRARRILVVEDNDELRDFAAILLSEMGHVVDTVASGDAALATLCATTEPFDVLFTDVVMAGMSGLELAHRVRHTWPDLEIVLVSGYSDALANAEGLEFPLISKPYSGAQLAAVL